MNTFLLISLYSVMVLLGLSTLAASFVFLGKWMIDNSDEPDADH